MADAPASLPRRGFLRGLLTLPLVGGGLAAVGAPSAVALPPRRETLDRYVAFLAHEHAAALAERQMWAGGYGEFDLADPATFRTRVPMFWFPDDPAAARLIRAAAPSSRAALVLAAVDLGLSP